MSCLCSPVAAAAGGWVWPTKSCGNPSLYLWPSFLHGRTGVDSNGRLLSLATEAMVKGYLECVSKVIYCSTYVGIVFRSLIFETSNFNPSTLKFIVITTSMMLRQLIFGYKDSVHDPQEVPGKLAISPLWKKGDFFDWFWAEIFLHRSLTDSGISHRFLCWIFFLHRFSQIPNIYTDVEYFTQVLMLV